MRNRLIIAVAVVAAAIVGAADPTVLAASEQLNDSQNLVTLSGRTQQALTLAHSLADEHDEVTSYIAAGRPKSKAPSEQRSAGSTGRSTRWADADAPTVLLKDLDGIGAAHSGAHRQEHRLLEAHEAYSDVITELHALAEDLAEQLPPARLHTLAELDSAVQQSAAARDCSSRPSTSAHHPDGHQPRHRAGVPPSAPSSTGASSATRSAPPPSRPGSARRGPRGLPQTAPKDAKDWYPSTVTGPDVTTADKYLTDLTDQPTLSDSELDSSTNKVWTRRSPPASS